MSNQPLDFTRFAGPVTIAEIQSAYRDQRLNTGQHPDAVRVTPRQLASMLSSPEQDRFREITGGVGGYQILGLDIELSPPD